MIFDRSCFHDLLPAAQGAGWVEHHRRTFYPSTLGHLFSRTSCPVGARKWDAPPRLCVQAFVVFYSPLCRWWHHPQLCPFFPCGCRSLSCLGFLRVSENVLLKLRYVGKSGACWDTVFSDRIQCPIQQTMYRHIGPISIERLHNYNSKANASICYSCWDLTAFPCAVPY